MSTEYDIDVEVGCTKPGHIKQYRGSSGPVRRTACQRGINKIGIVIGGYEVIVVVETVICGNQGTGQQ